MSDEVETQNIPVAETNSVENPANMSSSAQQDPISAVQPTEIPLPKDLGNVEGNTLDLADEKKKLPKLPKMPSIPTEKILGLLLNFLVPLLALIGSSIAIFVFLLPSYKEIPILESSLSTKKTLSSQLERKVAALKELVDFSTQVDEYVLVTEKALISEPKIPELLSQIDIMIRESGMDVSSLNYSQSGTMEASGVKMVNAALSASGSFETLVSFLKSVENASRLVILEDFRYSYTDKDGDRQVSASFQLKSPYLVVSSSAVTDEPIELSISSQEFLEDMTKIKNLKHYDVSGGSVPIPVPLPVPAPVLLEEETPIGEETPVEGEVSIEGESPLFEEASNIDL